MSDPTPPTLPATPLWRNRDFVLLETGQLLSAVGSQATALAFPLLVLALTHSPAKAGLVGFVGLVPAALFSLFAGAAADRWNRRRMMIAADIVRAAAAAGLAVAILVHGLAFWQILVVAFVKGLASVFFLAAWGGALRGVVPRRQLPAAVAAEAGRTATVQLAGPPLGGALFGLARVVPFLFDAASYACSSVALLAMRTPFQEVRERDPAHLRTQIADGIRFLWGQPFLRTVALLFSLGNLTIPALLLVVIVAGKRHGLSSGEIGALTAAFGASVLAGSFTSSLLRRALSPRAILLLELWVACVVVVYLAWPNVYVLMACVLPQGFVIPSTNSVVHGYRVAITPDRLIGRVNSTASNIGLLISPLGPLVAGYLLDSTSPRATVAVFAGIALVLAVWGTASPSIRQAPSLDELEHTQA